MGSLFQSKTKIALLFSAACLISVHAYADENDLAQYCQQSGGEVEKMKVIIDTTSGWVGGQSKMFCNFHAQDGGFVSIGLESFASDEPSIAATFIKKLPEIAEDSPWYKGEYMNPSMNVCKHIGGASVGFVANGGFADQTGQEDICVFGDGSMVSAWSLIYMANHREGYDAIKENVKAQPFQIQIPSISNEEATHTQPRTPSIKTQ